MTSLLKLIDFHCHLDLFPNYLEMVKESEELGIKTLTVTNAPSVWRQNQILVKDCKHIRAALGLHPQLAHTHGHEISLFEEYLPETRYVGEVGLDGSSGYKETLELQRKVFKRILELCAAAKGKILTIHSRQAASEVIESIENYLPYNRGRVVLHWFTGSERQAKRAIDAGCYFSINIKMLESPTKRALVELLPKDRVLTESDAPFVKYNGSLICPRDVDKTIKKLSDLWAIDEEKTSEIIKKNLVSLLTLG
jgi:TatD DNase family protein